MFISTPHVTAKVNLGHNLVELILRSCNGSVSRECDPRDNVNIFEICKKFDDALLPIPIVLAFETSPTKIHSNKYNVFRKHKLPSEIVVSHPQLFCLYL